MEVVVQPQGLEDDSIISIRVGAVRRQGVVSSLRPFSFPLPPPTTDSFTVDVYRPISNSKLSLSKESRSHSVLMPTPPGSAPKALNLQVVEAAAPDPLAASRGIKPGQLQLEKSSGVDISADRQSIGSSVDKARAYLEKYDLQAFFRELLRHVLHEKPDDPFTFLARHLQQITSSPAKSGDDASEKVPLLELGEPKPSGFTGGSAVADAIDVQSAEPSKGLEASSACASSAVALQNARLCVENERMASEFGRLHLFAKEHSLTEAPENEWATETTSGDPLAVAENTVCQSQELLDRNCQLRMEHERLRSRLSTAVTWLADAVVHMNVDSQSRFSVSNAPLPMTPQFTATKAFLNRSLEADGAECGDDWSSEEEAEDEPKVMQRKRACGVSSEAFGSWNNRRAAFVPPRHKKTKAQEDGLLLAFASCPLFAHIDPEVMFSVVQTMPLDKYAAGKHIIRQGDDGDSLFVILSGTVECWNEAVNPRQFICKFSTGKIFGELAMLHNTPRKLSVIASQDKECTLARLNRTIYRNLIFRHQMTMHDRREDCLRRVQNFNTLSQEQITQLGDVLVSHRYDAGDIIVRQGDDGDELFIVYSGECAANVTIGSSETEDGEVDVQEHRRYGPGSLFGEQALIQRTKRAATVQACTETTILVLSRKKFERLLGPLTLLQSQRYLTDPRKSIEDFYQPGNLTGCRGAVLQADPSADLNQVPPEERTEWFAVYRPTSRDAIAQMLGGRGVGKGLNVKGKSAKRGRQSGFVPFLQISVNDHKELIDKPHPEARVRIFYGTDADRELALRHFEPLLEDLTGLHIVGDRVIFYIDSYEEVFGLEVPEPLMRKVYIDDKDITHQAGWETGRKSEPAFMDMNLSGLRSHTEPKLVLYQADAEDPFNPHGLLIAYAETSVKPVVSDFDTFLVGSRGMKYDNLATEQTKLQMWALDNTRDILETPAPGSWTTRWLEVIKKATDAGFYPKTPKFGFGDATSYRLVEQVVQATASTGAVRHGAECFNFFFPQELDDEYLVVWSGFQEDQYMSPTKTISRTMSKETTGEPREDRVSWKYLDEDELREFLVGRACEGFTFPLNPIWPVRDMGWYEVYEALISTPEGKESVSRWLNPAVQKKLESIQVDFPEGFMKSHAGGSRKSAMLDLDQSERAALAMDEYSADSHEKNKWVENKATGFAKVWGRMRCLMTNNTLSAALGNDEEDPHKARQPEEKLREAAHAKGTSTEQSA